MKETILKSDFTGEVIDAENDRAEVTIKYSDARRGVIVLDAKAHEVEEWASKGRKQQRRGRKTKTA